MQSYHRCQKTRVHVPNAFIDLNAGDHNMLQDLSLTLEFQVSDSELCVESTLLWDKSLIPSLRFA
jgi:hypothetical protein